MGLHLYCVTPAASRTEGVTGVDGAPVRTVPVAGLAVWASDHDAPPRPSIETARQHHAVVEVAMRQVTPVPLRFGQWVADEASLEASAAEHANEWAAALASFEGAAEYDVRILDPGVDVPARDVRTEAAGSGRAYLEAIAARRAGRERQTARGRAVAAEIEQAVAAHVVRTRVDALETTHGLATVAFLVRHDSADAYTAALEQAVEAHPGLRFLTSGPWPPWSFAT
ncbi:MAG: GvpL/GvpF family gas vesicle protein [Longimicrobiales bacterium]